MSAVTGKKVAIIGGGPGGLTLARLLQQSNAQVSVYERDQSRSARVQGSALDLHEESGLAALEAAGLIDAFWAHHRPDLNRLRLTDAHGTILYDHSRQMSGTGKRPEIERGPLRDLLLDSLQPSTVEWDCMHGEQVLLHFAGGKTALADIVIGSDGANSRLRELVTPIRPEYVGVSLVEALVPEAKQTIPKLWDLLGGSALIALGGERTIGMGTKPDGSILIGDAAHVIPPYAGEGVNMAMLDALVLSKLLISEESSSSAIAKYETEMFARMRHMTAETMANTEMFYAADAADRVVALFRSFGGPEAVPPASELTHQPNKIHI